MAQDPAFLFMYKDWLVSTAGWDADVRGWYINLLAHQADKPDGLINDLETLADLAGVKISQYQRFSVCWKDMLSAKFVKNDKGLLINISLSESLDDRRKYKNKQAKRGTVGAFVKKWRTRITLTQEQWNEVAHQMVTAILDLDKSDLIEKALKHTLGAYATSIYGNGNANGNNISKEIIDELLEGSEEKPQELKPKTVYQQCVDLYFNFFKGRHEGVPPKFEKKQGENMKSIISYLKTVVNEKKKGLKPAEREAEIVKSFNYILTNWDKLSDFTKQQVDICSMNSQINRIISELKAKPQLTAITNPQNLSADEIRKQQQAAIERQKAKYGS